MAFWKNKKVLVTGATGFLGAWLCKELASQKANVIGVSRRPDFRLLKLHNISKQIKFFSADIANPKEVQKLFEKTKPDFCFHLAGFSFPKKADETPLEAVSANVLGTSCVALQCARQNVRFVLASSVRVYPNRGLLDENSRLGESETYAFSKIKAEEVVRFLAKKKRLKAVIVRLATVYGPVRFPAFEHFVNNNIVCFLKGKTARNKKGYVRDFLFVKDAIDGVLAAGKNCGRFSGETFNISFGKSFLGSDLAVQIKKMIKQKPVTFNPAASLRIKNNRALEKLGWKPSFSLKEGLAETIKWYQKNPSVKT
ncbi:MAG: NAD(P)-dependent oxidoreductase [Candidatus Micrarchaeota archaeon]